MLRDASKQEKYTTAVDIIRQLALTGCRRSEMIGLKWTEADTEASYLRLEDSKEGESIRPVGLPVIEYLERRRTDDVGTYVFPGQGENNAFGSFPNYWKHLFEDSPLSDVTPLVLRHSFASIANDLGFTAALVGHAKGSVTSKYIHTLDTALIMAADTISGYIQGLLDGIEFKQTAYALDRDSRKAALARFLKRASGSDHEAAEEERRLAA
jgi:integrase